MMSRLRSLSVAAQMTLVIVGVTVFALAVYFSIAQVIDSGHARETLKKQTLMIALIAAEYNVSEMAFGYRREAGENLDRLFLLPEIEAAQLYDAEGRLFVGRSRPGSPPARYPESIPPRLEARVNDAGEKIEIFQPMVFRDIRHGTLRLSVSTVDYQLLLGKRLRFLLSILVLVLVLVVGVAAVVQRWISRPIHELIEKVQALAGGDLSKRVEVPASGGEIASLCRNVNLMADALGNRIREVEDARQLLQVVTDHIPAGVFWKDLDSVYVWSNRQFAQDAGISEAAGIAGKTDMDLPWKEEAGAVRATDRRIIESDQPEFNIVRFLRRADGTGFWADTGKVPLHDAGGRVIGILGSYIDITRRKKAEDALVEMVTRLKEAAARYAALISASKTGAWEYRATTGFLWCSPEYFSMLGREAVPVDREEMQNLEHALFELVHSDDREQARRAFSDYLANPVEMYQCTFRMQHADGRWIWILSRSQTLRDPQGNPTGVTVGTHIDITDRIQLEEQLRHSEKMKAIGQLAGGIAHDFNNQLSGILGSAELLLLKLNDPESRSYAEIIRTAGTRSSGLVKQLLVFARKGTVVSTPVNMHHLLAEVVGLLQHSIDRRITIVQRLDAARPMVLGDPSQLQSALLNLGINARDAMPDGGELVFATRLVEVEKPAPSEELASGRYLAISVRDTGHGMSREVLGRLFEPFFTTKAAGKGTGLGLAAVYGTVRGHGGVIRVESDVGRGTTFTLLLPLAAETSAEPTRKGPPELRQSGAGGPLSASCGSRPALPAQAGQGHILLVDDEEVVRLATCQMLESLGYRVTVCCDGFEALACLEKSDSGFDFAIIDLMMPRMSGPELFEALRRLRPELNVLIISGFNQDVSVAGLLAHRGVSFLGKPFQMDELARKIEELGLDNRNSLDGDTHGHQ